MALNFAKRSLKLENFSKLFPLSESKHLMSKRNTERFVTNISSTERYKRSAVPFLQRLLNDDYSKQRKDLAKLLRVNNGVFYNAPITYWKYTLLLLLSLIGDEVVFNFTSFHNVNWVNKNVYDSCSNITNTTMGSGPIIWTAPQVIITNHRRIISLIIVLQEDGVKYAVCGVPSHCSNGNMKIKIYVNNNSTVYQ